MASYYGCLFPGKQRSMHIAAYFFTRYLSPLKSESWPQKEGFKNLSMVWPFHWIHNHQQYLVLLILNGKLQDKKARWFLRPPVHDTMWQKEKFFYDIIIPRLKQKELPSIAEKAFWCARKWSGISKKKWKQGFLSTFIVDRKIMNGLFHHQPFFLAQFIVILSSSFSDAPIIVIWKWAKIAPWIIITSSSSSINSNITTSIIVAIKVSPNKWPNSFWFAFGRPKLEANFSLLKGQRLYWCEPTWYY